MMNTYETDSAQPNDFKADCSFQIQIDQMCQQHLIESTNQMDLCKGINVCFTYWDTNHIGIQIMLKKTLQSLVKQFNLLK